MKSEVKKKGGAGAAKVQEHVRPAGQAKGQDSLDRSKYAKKGAY